MEQEQGPIGLAIIEDSLDHIESFQDALSNEPGIKIIGIYRNRTEVNALMGLLADKANSAGVNVITLDFNIGEENDPDRITGTEVLDLIEQTNRQRVLYGLEVLNISIIGNSSLPFPDKRIDKDHDCRKALGFETLVRKIKEFGS